MIGTLTRGKSQRNKSLDKGSTCTDAQKMTASSVGLRERMHDALSPQYRWCPGALNDGAGQLGHTTDKQSTSTRERVDSSVLHHQITLLNIITAPRLSFQAPRVKNWLGIARRLLPPFEHKITSCLKSDGGVIIIGHIPVVTVTGILAIDHDAMRAGRFPSPVRTDTMRCSQLARC